MWTREERRLAILNPKEYIERNMAICDEEIKTRKLTKFLNEKEKSMSIRDIRLIEAAIKMHEAARIVYQDIQDNELSEDIRKCADRLNAVIKTEMHTGK